jgi:zinc protease
VLQAGRTRSVYLVEYASDPQNVVKAGALVAQEITAMQDTAVGSDELTRAKACLVRQLPLSEAGITEIAEGMLGRTDLGLPLDEPTQAAQHFVTLEGTAVQDAFRKWLRPKDLVRVSEGPPPS